MEMVSSRNTRRSSRRVSERREKERMVALADGVVNHQDDQTAIGLEHQLVDEHHIPRVEKEPHECVDLVLEIPRADTQRRRSSIYEVFETEKFEDMVQNLLLSSTHEMGDLSDNDSSPSYGLFSRESYDAMCDDIMFRDEDAGGDSYFGRQPMPWNERHRQKKRQCGRGGEHGARENVGPNGADTCMGHMKVRKDAGTQTVSPTALERQMNEVATESTSPFRVVSPCDAQCYVNIPGTQAVRLQSSTMRNDQESLHSGDTYTERDQILILRELFQTIWEKEMPTYKDFRLHGYGRTQVNRLVHQGLLQRHREVRQPQRFSWIETIVNNKNNE